MRGWKISSTSDDDTHTALLLEGDEKSIFETIEIPSYSVYFLLVYIRSAKREKFNVGVKSAVVG